MKMRYLVWNLVLILAVTLTINADGQIDTSFGNQGRTVLDSINGIGILSGKIAVQPDNKIIFAGHSNTGFAYEMTVVRFTANGLPDSTFGSNGVARVSFGDVFSTANDVAIQPDGKIVVVGFASNNFGRDTDFAVARLNPNGTLDSTFGNAGKVTTSFEGNLSEAAFGVALQPDGKIVVAGFRQNNATSESWFAVARYNSNGSLDNTFNSDGRFFTKAGENNEFSSSVRTMALQSDGKILVAGGVDDSQFALIRVTGAGALDLSFGGDGKVQTTVKGLGDEGIVGLSVQNDGKIVAVGFADGDNQSGGGDDDWAVVRYNSDGLLDTTFDSDGKATYSFANNLNYEQANSVITLPNGKIIIAGGVGSAAGTGVVTSDFGLLRLNSNGTPDNSFGNNGFTRTSFTEPASISYQIAVQSDGKIILGGLTGTGDISQDGFSPALVRYTNTSSNARPQFDFDGDGKADISLFRPSNGIWYAIKSSDNQVLTPQWGIPTDRIVPADYNGDGKTDFAVFRDGFWYILLNGGGFQGFQWGAAGDIPFSADFDGDGKDDLGVFRNGTWYILRSGGGTTTQIWGIAGDIPVVADYDGDRKSDFGVFRNGVWYLFQSTDGVKIIQWGSASDKPVPADYDGDGKADVAVFRNGFWYFLNSQTGFQGSQWGASGDLPTPADYDGDGKTDIAIFRNGTWYLQRTTQGVQVINFGVTADKPAPNAFIP